ncbi:MAG TPA: type I secretion protein TolC, partial [Rhodospirillaceae bacterium]|nr:type I secretion protein TolC [Rhodospirillaceae bacterium]
MKLKYGLSTIAILMVWGATAPPAISESLREALARTYETNPGLAAERARLRSTDESVTQALSGWRPEVEIYGSYRLRNRDRSFSSSVADTQSTDQVQSIGLGISQNLFRGFRTIAETNKARNRVGAGRANLIDTEQSV